PPITFYAHATSFFYYTQTSHTDIYTLSLHDALPIYPKEASHENSSEVVVGDRPNHHRIAYPACDSVGINNGPSAGVRLPERAGRDRKSTRLNSSHQIISYAVFCLKKKINKQSHNQSQ